MEYKKNFCCSPRDMAEDEIVTRILGEDSGKCGCREGTETVSVESNERRGCKCGSRCEMRNSSDNARSGNTCGGSRCGCANNAEGRKEDRENDCSCALDMRLAGSPLAMVYSPDQEWRELYTDEEALSRGTLFKELDKPFYPGCKTGRCSRADN